MERKKSTRSGAYGDNCVEVGADWMKSDRSTASGAGCVEVKRPHDAVVYVRDSKDPDGPVLRFTRDEWEAFVGGAKDGEFDLA